MGANGKEMVEVGVGSATGMPPGSGVAAIEQKNGSSKDSYIHILRPIRIEVRTYILTHINIDICIQINIGSSNTCCPDMYLHLQNCFGSHVWLTENHVDYCTCPEVKSFTVNHSPGHDPRHEPYHALANPG